MKTKILRHFPFVLAVLLIAGIIGQCTSHIARYEPISYQYAVSLKVDSLALMDKAGEMYSTHLEEANKLIINVEKAYEYASGIPKNSIIAKQWEILKDPDRNLLGGFIKLWKEKSHLRPGLIEAAKKLVSDGFDMIIGLESGKIKPSEITGE